MVKPPFDPPPTPIAEEAKPKRKRVNSKRKGSNFENDVAKRLAEALAPLQFRRAQSSGAILGGKNADLIAKFSKQAAALFVGDVVPTNEDELLSSEGRRFDRVIECKFYRDADRLQDLFDGDRLLSWYNQAAKNSETLGRPPLVIFKFNHTEAYCLALSSSDLPSTLTTMVKVYRDRRELVVFRLGEALKDRNWWLTEPQQA